MKTIKDITPEQAIEIAKLIYPFPECVKSEYKFKYQPYDSSWYEDAREYIRVEWDGILAADKVVPLFIEINTNLDCYCYYSTGKGAERMPNRNQNAIQKKFIEWDIEPTPFGVNKEIVSNEQFRSKLNEQKNNMKEEFTDLETSKRLKELGFNEGCYTGYLHSNVLEEIESALVRNKGMAEDWVSAPSYQQVKRWLWDNHKIYFKLQWYGENKFKSFAFQIGLGTIALFETNSPIKSEIEVIKQSIEYIHSQIKK